MPSKRPSIHFVSDEKTITELKNIADDLGLTMAGLLRILVRSLINNYEFNSDPFEIHHAVLREYGYERRTD